MTRVVITGAPGTGKTTLVEHLSGRYTTVPEPAREVIAEHNAATGESTLDQRPELFVDLLVERSVENYESVTEGDTVIFDRGLPDCVAYARVYDLAVEQLVDRLAHFPYDVVFMARPWREIYLTDELRKATFEQVLIFHEALVEAYDRLGYEPIELPDASVAERASFLAEQLAGFD